MGVYVRAEPSLPTPEGPHNVEPSDVEQELFLTQQRLAEARLALVEAARQKDELRDTATALVLELRELRVRVEAAEGMTRAAVRERQLAEERLEARDRSADALFESLAKTQRDVVAAHESNEERDLQIDQLQLQIMELRMALARARGFAPPADRAEDRRAASS